MQSAFPSRLYNLYCQMEQAWCRIRNNRRHSRQEIVYLSESILAFARRRFRRQKYAVLFWQYSYANLQIDFGLQVILHGLMEA